MKLILITLIVALQQFFANSFSLNDNTFHCLNNTVILVKNIVALQEQNNNGVDTLVHSAQLNQIISDISPLFKTCRFLLTPPKNIESCITENFDEFQPLNELVNSEQYLYAYSEFQNILENIIEKCNISEKEPLQYFENVFHQPPKAEKTNNLRPYAASNSCSSSVLEQTSYILSSQDGSQLSSLSSNAYNCSSQVSQPCQGAMYNIGSAASSQNYNSLSQAYYYAEDVCQ